MGALANEAGLKGSDIGRIQIRFDHTLVELPSHLTSGDIDQMKDIVVSGQAIDIRPDAGPPSGRPGSHRGGDRGDRGDRGKGGFRGNNNRRGERRNFR